MPKKPMEPKATAITVIDAESRCHFWWVVRVPRAYSYGGGGSKRTRVVTGGEWKGARVVAGWQLNLHNGRRVFIEGTWSTLVDELEALARNCGMTIFTVLSRTRRRGGERV